MSSPRRESEPGPTTAGCLILERQLVRAYHALCTQEVTSLWPPDRRKAAAIRVLGGKLAPTQARYAEERVTEVVAGLILRLTPEQQPLVAALLLIDAPDLSAVVAELVRLERNINYRDEDPALKRDDDDWKATQVGLGKFRPRLGGGALAQQQRKQAREAVPAPKLGPLLVLEPPFIVPRPVLRTKKRRHRKASVALRGQYEIWPPVSGAVGGAIGL